MPYGTVKVDNITFDQGGTDQNVTASGIYRAITSGVTVTGTISGATASFTSGNFVTATFTSTAIIASGTAASPSLSILSDPNTGLYSPGADQVALATAGTGRLFIDSSGRLLLGTSSSRNSRAGGTDYANTLQIEADTNQAGIAITRFTDSNIGSFFNLQKGRGTIALPTVVSSGDAIGDIRFSGFDGTNFSNGAGIRAEVDGTPGANDMPGRLIFSTTADGTASFTERMRLDSSGRLGLGTSSPASLFHMNTPATGGGAIFSSQGYNYATISQIISSADAVFGGGVIASDVGGEVKKITADAAHYVKMQIGEGITFHTNITGASGTSVARTTNERMRIDSNGNVNIGTGTTGLFLSPLTGASSYITTNATNTATDLIFGTSTAIPIRFITGNTERARIDSSGRVGIGTSSPGALLHVNGEDSNGLIARFASGTNYQGFDFSGTTDAGNGTLVIQPNTIPGSGTAEFYTYFKKATSGGTTNHNVIIDGKVGIGTSAPGFAFDIQGAQGVGLQILENSSGANRRLRITQEAAGVTYDATYSTVGNAHRWLVGGTEFARIDSSGRVGIGTTSPGSILTVSDPGTGLQFTNAASGNYNIGLLSGTGFADAYVFNRANSPLILGTNNTERARIDSSGRLLVGTSTSVNNLLNGALQVVGTSTDSYITVTRYSSTAGDPPGIILGRSKSATKGTNTIVASGDTLGAISFSGANGTSFDQAANIIAFVDGTPGASGDMPGRLVFSTTADGAASPTERMRISSNNNINFFSGAATFTPEAITLTGAGASEEYVVTKSGVDTFRFGVDSGGPRITALGAISVIAGGSGGVSLATSATSWAAISDERHKTNLQPITDAFDKVGTLRAVTGRYVTDNEDVSRSFLIAQDVQAVLPEAIDDSNETQLSLRYSEVIPLLVGALKEAKERIEALEADVALLKGE
jgi:hypothetical protein